MLLIDMEMPKSCLECPLADRDNGDECPIYAIDKYDYAFRRFKNCPLKEIDQTEGAANDNR